MLPSILFAAISHICVVCAAAAPAAMPQQEGPASNPAPPPEVVLELRSNTRVKGTLLEETDTAYRLLTAEMGEITVPREAVVAVLAPDAALGPPATPVKEAPPGLLGTGFLAGWQRSLELGFSGKDGDEDSFDLYGQLGGEFEDETERWRARLAYFYGTTESETTKNEGFANIRHDWLFVDNPLFFWAEGRAEYNEFKDYRARTGVFAGLGYAFYDTEQFQLLGRAGVGGSYEFGDVNDFIPEAVLGVDMRWAFTEHQRVEFSTTFFPDLDELGEYRNSTEAAYSVDLQESRRLTLRFGLQNEYESITADDSEHNELTYFGALVFGF